MSKKKVQFCISGDFVTQTARNWFFVEHRPYEVVEALLLSCMTGTDLPQGTLKSMAQDVLLGRAEFRGNSSEGTFCYSRLDNPAEVDLFSEYSKLHQECEKCKKERDSVVGKYLNLLNALSLWAEGSPSDAVQELDDNEAKQVLLDIIRQYDDFDEIENACMEPETGNAMLDSFLKQNRIAADFEDDYGWLDPMGNFTPVEWGEHQTWAYNEAKRRGYVPHDAFQYGTEGDILIERGWVLLHSPSMGVPVVTQSPIKPITKAQREFLYDYFSKRDMPERAAAFLSDND